MIAELQQLRTVARPNKRKVITQAKKKTINAWLAAIAAGYLPIGSYVLAHVEAPNMPWLYLLVAGALTYSAPTLVKWSMSWCNNLWKAIGFTILLEGLMVLSHITWLSMTALLILTSINSAHAYNRCK